MNDLPERLRKSMAEEKQRWTRPKEFLDWAVETFGPIASDRRERLLRFLEEAIELAHAEELPEIALERLIERVYSRKPGAIHREIGQAQACLETFAEAIGLSADNEAAIEFDRVRCFPKEYWQKRHAAKTRRGITNDTKHKM